MSSTNPYISHSMDVVEYFRGQGSSLQEIGEWLDLSESFVSRVARGERSFTLAHLARLERIVGTSLPLLLLEARRKDVPEQHREMYEEAIRLLKVSAKFRRRVNKPAIAEAVRT
jgi:plasmid maintenance system antidote protein VapI